MSTLTATDRQVDDVLVLPWTGTHEPQAFWQNGLPTWRYGWVPIRLKLATRRQLRDQRLSRGPQSPCAQVVWGPRVLRDARVRWAYLYRVELAVPARTNTAAQELARHAAMTARRTCDVCGEVRDYCIPKVSLGGCGLCWEAGRCEGTIGPFDQDVAA